MGRWVIIATDRAKRPTDFVRERVQIRGTGFCPFCYKNESKTPPEVLAYRNDGSARNTPGWTLRVVSNKFPALGIEGTLNRQGEGLYDRMNGVGAHEVIIETPEHSMTLATLPVERDEQVLWSYRDRMLDLAKDRRFKRREFERLAAILKDMLTRLDKVLDYPAYNYIVHTSPVSEPADDYYHWHVEIMPKLTKVAGFEWGTGFYINPTPPEEAAKFLREVSLAEPSGDRKPVLIEERHP